MARPRRINGIKPPNDETIRVQRKIKAMINSVYRRVIKGPSNMPIGDKLESILNFCNASQKKVEGLEMQVLDLREAIEVETIIREVRHKGLQI